MMLWTHYSTNLSGLQEYVLIPHSQICGLAAAAPRQADPMVRLWIVPYDLSSKTSFDGAALT